MRFSDQYTATYLQHFVEIPITVTGNTVTAMVQEESRPEVEESLDKEDDRMMHCTGAAGSRSSCQEEASAAAVGSEADGHRPQFPDLFLCMTRLLPNPSGFVLLCS